MDRQSINLGRQLKFAREYRNISMQKLCLNINGLSQSNLSKCERGFKTVSEDKLKLIMDFLNFPFEWLYRHNSKINFL